MDENGTLTLKTKYDNEYLVISLSDTGRGIPEDELNKIFHPFFTTKQRGTGLGLSIAWRIIEAHNGRIKVKNNEDKGATFTVYLPLG
jgi:signal transduction histidine kinase